MSRKLNFYEMTKEELILLCKRLQSENDTLQDELDRLSDCYVEMENQLADRINALDALDTIKDVNWFKWRLEVDGLLTPKLESFIDEYLKYYNDSKGSD